MNPVLQEIYSTIIPSAPYLIAAYVLLLVVLFIWLAITFAKQQKLAKRLEILEEENEERSRAKS